MEEQIFFMSEHYRLEGLFQHSKSDEGVVITHPHPLYGGDMYNYVVEAVARAFRQNGYSTLRFNFRGAGDSEGQYDQGIGEQNDVRAAIDFMICQNIGHIDLAGYSFGAYVNAHIGCDRIRHQIMVSPPVNFIRFDKISKIPCLKLVICGDEDDFAQISLLKTHLGLWNPNARLEIVSDADHFYSGRLRELEEVFYERKPL